MGWIPNINLPSIEQARQAILGWIPDIQLPSVEEAKQAITNWIPNISLPSIGEAKQAITNWIPNISLPSIEGAKNKITEWISSISLPSFEEVKKRIMEWISGISLPSIEDAKNKITEWIPSINFPSFDSTKHSDTIKSKVDETIDSWKNLFGFEDMDLESDKREITKSWLEAFSFDKIGGFLGGLFGGGKGPTEAAPDAVPRNDIMDTNSLPGEVLQVPRVAEVKPADESFSLASALKGLVGPKETQGTPETTRQEPRSATSRESPYGKDQGAMIIDSPALMFVNSGYL